MSAGLLDDEKAQVLKAAGLDRLNHNLNTSREHLRENLHDPHLRRPAQHAAVGQAGGTRNLLGGDRVAWASRRDELIEVARTLASVGAESIPVNFLLPFEGNVLEDTPADAVPLSPAYCLRVLCLFRFTSPAADVRCVPRAGSTTCGAWRRCACTPPTRCSSTATSTARGAERRRTYQMIRDAAFEIVSDTPLAELMEEIPGDTAEQERPRGLTREGVAIKSMQQLRPAQPVSPGA